MGGSKKFKCPACGRKTFVPYIDEKKNIVDVERFGRCERINNCGYLLYPKLKGDDDWTPPAREPEIIRPTEFIGKEIVEKTFNEFQSNVFFMYLVKLFGREKAFELQEMYNIGTAANGGTIYWQQDRGGNFRTGKVMYYNDNGKRRKDKNSWFVHSKIKDDFNFQQCFFGLHLVDGTKPVALCESEKTAVLMSVYRPEITWLATGGSEMINGKRLIELPRLDYVFPDGGQFEKWEQKTRTFNRKMDTTVEQAISKGILEAGADILDLVLMIDKK